MTTDLEQDATSAGVLDLLALRPLSLNEAEYMADLAAFDLTDDQKVELLRTLWSLMQAFVEIGFRADACGQLLGLDETTDSPVRPDDIIGCIAVTETDGETWKGTP